ncbi:isocitrate lyase/PEP mutase family protein [Yersinia alsatica]|uniref:isocitrate lyase/PEP mutase family protein n=1 Tax=Yersinia alsatica TaxID=2890317 RepID=UPI00119D5B3A|nr:isocitrate lyase/phosphoenolpyruvate mutase family protein [Yersinia alsatica]
MNFTQLHQQTKPLLMANVWDVASMQVAEAAGYLALGTSSAAIAAILGYSDGDGISFAEVRQLVARLQIKSKLPISVDLEAGYSDQPKQVVANILELASLGIIGVNLEDSIVRHGIRTLVETSCFAEKLDAIRQGLIKEKISMFNNVRTDTFLLGMQNVLEETLVRGQTYAKYGADGFFVPCMTKESDITAVIEAVPLPLNLMCMPDLPSFEILQRLCVKRISMGNFVHAKLQSYLQRMLVNIQSERTFNVVFAHENNG